MTPLSLGMHEHLFLQPKSQDTCSLMLALRTARDLWAPRVMGEMPLGQDPPRRHPGFQGSPGEAQDQASGFRT